MDYVGETLLPSGFYSYVLRGRFAGQLDPDPQGARMQFLRIDLRLDGRGGARQAKICG